MAHFHVVCLGNYAFKYVGGVLEFRKLDFRDLKGQFDVKRPNLGSQKAKISDLGRILASRTHNGPIYMIYAMGFVP